MVASAIVDASYLVALLSHRDVHHEWATEQAVRYTRPWQTCEAALFETFHMLRSEGASSLMKLLRRKSLSLPFVLAQEFETVLLFMQKYADVPMSLADACLVRMTETLPNPLVLTTDSDFRIYRRHSRQVIPCAMPV
jgi:predicted nucleic acid-binding protein